MSYKKRAKNGWQVGKGEKETSNASERMFAKEEIIQELAKHEAGEDFREKGRGNKLTRLEKLERRLKGIEAKRDRCYYLDDVFGGQSMHTFYKKWIKDTQDKIDKEKGKNNGKNNSSS